MQMTPITRRGSRQHDSQGYGHFGAPRQRPTGMGTHQGIDLITDPGELLFAPIDGDIVREAIYGPFTGIVIRGSGAWSGYDVKVLYARGYRSGPVKAGDLIGYAEDISIKYGSNITNHVHVEVRTDGVLVSPHYLFGQMCM